MHEVCICRGKKNIYHENQAAGFAAKNTWNKILVPLKQAQTLSDFKKPVILKATKKVLFFQKLEFCPCFTLSECAKKTKGRVFFSAFYITHVGLSIL